MAGLNEVKRTPWEKTLDNLQRMKDKTGADYVQKDGVGLGFDPSRPGAEHRRLDSSTPGATEGYFKGLSE